MLAGDLAIVRNVSTGAPTWVYELYRTREPFLILGDAHPGNPRDVRILHKSKRKMIGKKRLKVVSTCT